MNIRGIGLSKVIINKIKTKMSSFNLVECCKNLQGEHSKSHRLLRELFNKSIIPQVCTPKSVSIDDIKINKHQYQIEVRLSDCCLSKSSLRVDGNYSKITIEGLMTHINTRVVKE